MTDRIGDDEALQRLLIALDHAAVRLKKGGVDLLIGGGA